MSQGKIVCCLCSMHTHMGQIGMVEINNFFVHHENKLSSLRFYFRYAHQKLGQSQLLLKFLLCDNYFQVDQETLKKILHYNPETGVFRWGLSGIQAGSDRNGYVKIQIQCKSYSAHRLAFLYMTGEIPQVVDHINRKRSDNRWVNLRASTHSLNATNRQRKGIWGLVKQWFRGLL